MDREISGGYVNEFLKILKEKRGGKAFSKFNVPLWLEKKKSPEGNMNRKYISQHYKGYISQCNV